MKASYTDYLVKDFGIDRKVIDYVSNLEAELSDSFNKADEIAGICQLKVLKAFQENHINATHFNWSSGYGYDDAGREAVEKVYSSVFNTEAALVRPNIVNGTHAIASTLLGLLAPGDEFIEISGTPYDTLLSVIGKSNETFKGTIIDYGISYKEIPLTDDLDLDFEAISKTVR